MKNFFVLIIGLSLVACGENTSTTTFQGVLQSVQSSFTIVVDPPPQVTVLGRNQDEFEYTISTAAPGQQVSFSLKGVPENQELVFEISGNIVETVLSFPVNTSLDRAKLPALAPQSYGTFVDLAEDDGGNVNIEVDENLGVVAGLVEPSFSDGVVSTAGMVTDVRMVQKNSDSEVNYSGPYFFDSTGTLVDSGDCPNQECNYIFYNVPEGAYRFQFLDNGNNVLSERDVVVLATRLTFGIQ